MLVKNSFSSLFLLYWSIKVCFVYPFASGSSLFNHLHVHYAKLDESILSVSMELKSYNLSTHLVMYRPARRCVRYHWAAALSAGAHTGWWSGKSPQPEYSPEDKHRATNRFRRKGNRYIKERWTEGNEKEKSSEVNCRRQMHEQSLGMERKVH